jgi:GSCFA family protein
MQFQTKVPIAKSTQPINYSSEILSLGSCFAVNIAEQFDYYQFPGCCNPFGILFHPNAILEAIQRAILNEKFTESDLFFHNDLWHCFDFHSELSHPDKSILLQKANTQLESLRTKLHQSTHLIITYGTAWVYRHRASSKIVANCHKVQQAQFQKELLDIAAIESAIQQTIVLVSSVNQRCSIIFTISPVRHIKDGFVENQRSKAHLIAGLQQTLALQSVIEATYFPSYEIMMDELRDYRFYAADMLHPNPTAILYIWERFSQTHIAENSFPVMEEIDIIRKAMQHRPFHPDSESHRQFLSKLQLRKQIIQQQFPHITF